jgi:hypothetical protein
MATIYGILLIRQFALSMYTLPVALANLTGEHVQDTELKMMASAVMITSGLLGEFKLLFLKTASARATNHIDGCCA